MRGSANVPAKKPTVEDLDVQKKLKGTETQFVGFNEQGEATPKDMLKGTEKQYIGFDAEGNQVAKELPESGGSLDIEGQEGQFVGFDAEGNLVPVNAPASTGTAFFGTIGTNWTEDAATGVKSQLVEIEGVLEAHDLGCLDVVMTHDKTSEGHALFVEEQNQFLDYITNGFAETVDGGVMFYIYGEANTVEIPFALVVV